MPQDRDSRDRREQRRIEKLNLVQVSRFDADGARIDLVTGRTLDISRGGVRLELHHTLPEGSALRLTLALEDGIAEVGGKVAHIEKLDADRCAVGIEFDELDDAARELIDRYVAAISDSD